MRNTHHVMSWTLVLGRLNRILDLSVKILLGATFAAMIALICMEVFLRNWHGASLAWYDEVGRLLLVWATFLGAAVATKDKTHYVVDFVETSLGGNLRKVLNVVSDVVVGGVALVFVVQGIVLMDLESTQHLAATGLSLKWRDSALVVGAILTLMFCIRHLALTVGQGILRR